MASASLQEIKSRIKSVSSTMQMTKAMELVAGGKLRRARTMAENSRSFTATLLDAIGTIRSSGEVMESVWSEKREGLPKLFIVIAGDRGLAGGYNSNVLKLAERLGSEEDFYIPIGRRSQDYYTRRGRNIFSAIPQVSEAGVGDAIRTGEAAAEAFREGRFSEIVVIYTRFISMLSCQPTAVTLLPLTKGDEVSVKCDPIYEDDAQEMLEKIVPTYVGGMLNSAILEASASEQSSRRNAMSSANKNAAEIIDTLSISYNRARQGAITQEITEIISGSDAL